jgi:tungstate transport system substrate-binding protein
LRGAILVAAASLAACGDSPARSIILATTTSVQNSGLLDRLLPAFRADTGIDARVHLVGSGRALQMMNRGQADVVISHAPRAEATALAASPSWLYRKFMFNDFVIVGPREDPARVRQARDAADALRRVAAADASFLSRGDESGTHERERALWDDAGVKLAEARLLTSGQGMANTLRLASDQDAYTLTDRATFLQLRDQLRLELLFEHDAQLINTYAVLVAPGPHRSDAVRFAEWISIGGGRSIVAAYRVQGTTAGFQVWPERCPNDRPDSLLCR